jgi:hypothetical protein
MSRPYKRAAPLAQKQAPGDAGRAEKDAARPGRDTRGWVSANKLPGQKFEARHYAVHLEPLAQALRDGGVVPR